MLQAMVDGVWYDVPCPPGSVVVNVGDLLGRWTRGAFHSPLHRVRAAPAWSKGSHERGSRCGEGLRRHRE